MTINVAQVRDTTSTRGTGPIRLDKPAPAGYRSLAQTVAVGTTGIRYRIEDASGNIERGIGTLSAASWFERQAVTASTNGGDFVAIASAATLYVEALDGDAPQLAVRENNGIQVEGTPAVNNTLTAFLTLGRLSPGWQWYRDGGNGPVAIAGATNAAYALLTADAGKTLTVRVPTLGLVSAPILVAGVAIVVAPIIATAPAINGTPTVGVASSFTPGSYIGSPATVTWNWTLDGAVIAGTANASQYVPVAGDATKALRVVEVATNAAGSSGNNASPAKVVAAAASAPVVAGAPSIDGTPQVGVASSFTRGTYTGGAPTGYTQQWTIDGVDIAGETGAQYTPASSDATKSLRVREIASNGAGPSAANTSAAKQVNAAAADTRPRSGLGPANPTGDQSIFDAMLPGMTPLAGSVNGGAAGTFVTTVDATKYWWVLIPTAAFGGGVHVKDLQNGASAFHSAKSAGLDGSPSVDPITAANALDLVISGVAFKALRSAGRQNAAYDHFTLSPL